jgi:hypothetical protein
MMTTKPHRQSSQFFEQNNYMCFAFASKLLIVIARENIGSQKESKMSYLGLNKPLLSHLFLQQKIIWDVSLSKELFI